MREKLMELLDKLQDSGVVDIPAGFGSTYKWIPNKQIAENLIANGVTIPVRCNQCSYWDKAKVNKKGFLICPASGMEITADDFCSYGERKDT